MTISYQCPVCDKTTPTAKDLVRHMLGRGDSVHRDWITTRGFNYSEMLAAQLQAFGSEEYKRLAEVLENETKIEG